MKIWKNIIKKAQEMGSTAKTKTGARKFLLRHLPRPITGREVFDWRNGPEAAARYREEKINRRADGRALILGYSLDDPNTPGRIQDRAHEENRKWDSRRCVVPTRDNYGAIYADNFPTHQLPRPDTRFFNALDLISAAKKKKIIPESYDEIEWDEKSRASGEALHYDLYDYAKNAAIICLRRTEGSRYGVKTLSKKYVLIQKYRRKITAIDVEIPVAKYAKMPDIQNGEIVACATGKKKIVLSLKKDIAFKAVAVDGDNLKSIFSGEKYEIGKLKKEKAADFHSGGYYCYQTISRALSAEVPETSIYKDAPRVIVRCEVSGQEITYGNGKIARTYLRPLEIVASQIT